MQKFMRSITKSMQLVLAMTLLFGGDLLGQSFVTAGGTVTSGYWNATNTSGLATFIVPNDPSIAFVSLQIEVNDDGTYTQIGDVEAASAQQSKSLSRTAAQIESAGDFDDGGTHGDGDTFAVVAVYITGGLVSVDTTTLATGIEIDQTAPAAFQVGAVITTGGNVANGYWNDTNTGLAVTVPIANDASLQNGSLQITGYVGGNPAEDLGTAADVLIISTNQTVNLVSTDFVNKAWFLDSQTFSLAATLSDAAGNSTNATASATTLSIDQTAPTISTVTSTKANGTYGVGTDIGITVNFDESVTLSGGNLLTNLNAGAQLTTNAINTSTSFSETYTVSEGDDATSLNVTSFELSGGSAKLLDAAGNNADLTTIAANLADNTDLVVDGSTPSVSNISSSTTNASYGVGDEINITITFSEALTLSGGNLLVDIDASGTDVTISPFSSSTTATGTYTVADGDASSDLTVSTLSLSAGSLVDAGGNSVDLTLPVGNNLADNKALAVDGAAPATFTVSTVTVTGGDVVSGYWNSTNENIEVIVPIATDASLENGTVQVQGFFGDVSGAENVGSTTTILGANLGGNVTVTIAAAQLEAISGFAEGETLKITAELADAGGNSTVGTQSANTFLIDQVVPTIASISSTTADGTYGIGDAVNVTISFSEAVSISGGNLLTNLSSGAQLSTSSIASTSALSQTYTIAALDESLDLTVSSLVLSAGSVDLTDAAGNPIDRSLPVSNLGNTSALVIDGIVPTLSSITSTSADGSYGVGDVINITVTFSEAVTLSGGNLQVDHDASASDVLITSISSSTTGTQDYTVESGDASDDLTVTGLSLSAGTLQDAGGNNVDLSDLTAITNIDDGSDIAVDGASPAAFTVGTVTVTGGDVVSNYWNATNTGMTVQVPIASDNSLNGGNVQVQGYFNDISGAVDVGDSVAIAGAHLGGNLTVTLTATEIEAIPGFADDLVLKLTAVITDAGGNTTTGTQSANTFTIDQTAPVLTAITSTTANGTYGVGDDINVTLTFDEAVTLSSGNLITTLNTGSELTTGTISSSTSVSEIYTIAEGDTSSDLTVSSIALSVGTADLVDAAGNQADLNTPAGNNIAHNSALVIDGVLPTLTSITSTTGNGNFGIGRVINITLNFSEDVTLSGGNLLITTDAGATTTSISSISNAATATATYTVVSADASSDFNVSALSLSAGSLQDAGGNDVDLADISGISNIDDTRDIVIDGTAPAAFQVSTVVATGGTVVSDYWNGTNTGINVTVPIANDVTLQNGKLLIKAKVGSNTYEAVGDSSTILIVNGNKTVTLSYNAVRSITGFTDGGVLTFTAVMRDNVYNYTTGTASATTLTIDETDPTISSITSNPVTGSIAAGGSVDITVTFSEAVTLSGGNIVTTLETGDNDAELTTTTVSNASSFTETYTVAVNDTASDLNVRSLALSTGTLLDAAGNELDSSLPVGNNLANNSDLVIDGVAPTVASITSSSPDGDYAFGDEVAVSIHFSEALTLTGGDLVLTMETGTTDREVTIATISNDSVATGIYTVQAGDASTDLTVNSLALSAGSLEDGAGNSLDLTLPASADNLAGSSDIVVDGSVPADFTVGTVITTGGTVVSGYWNATNTGVDITVPIADDASLLTGRLQIRARSGSNTYEDLGADAEIAAINSDQTMSFTFSTIEAITGFTEGSILEFKAVITDIVGNSTTGTASATTLIVDQVDPTVSSITSVPVIADLQVGGTADITITFSEALTLSVGNLITTLETGDTDAQLTTSSIANAASVIETYTVSAGEVAADLNVSGLALSAGTLRDAAGNNLDPSLPAGNNLADNSALVVDGTIPTIVSISAATVEDTLGLGESVTLTLEFSEAVTLVGGTLGMTLETGTVDQEVAVAGFGLTSSITGNYTVQVSDSSTDLTVTAVAISGGTLQDAVGNDVDLALPASNNLGDNNDILVDGIVPEAFLTGDIQTMGDSVVTGYWNADNTSFEVVLPVTGSDGSLDGGSAYLEARINSNAFAVLGDTYAVGTNPVTLSITRTQLENQLAGYLAGGTIQVRGVLVDIAGNTTTGTQSAVDLIIDQTVPNQTTTGNLVVSGGIVNQGYWNPTNTSLVVATPLENDGTLVGGSFQVQARNGVLGSFTDIGSSTSIAAANTTLQTTLTAADLSNFGAADGDTLIFRAVVSDIAGNLTTGLSGANSLVIDSSAPIAFQVGTLLATGGTVVNNYFNSGNSGAEITVPIDPADNTLVGGTIQLRVSVDGAAAADFMSPVAITTLSDALIPISRAQLENIAGYEDSVILTYAALITDAAGNATLGSASTDQLEIDETLPVANASEDLRPQGSNAVSGYWNNTDTGVLVKVPIDITDGSLISGTLAIAADLTPPSDDSFEIFATTANITALGSDTLSITIPEADIEALDGGVGFADGLDIIFRTVITDVAGNSATSATSALSLQIDQAAPAAPPITDMVVIGDNVAEGIWNAGADSLLLVIPVNTGADASLDGGFYQVTMSIGDAPTENAYELVVIDSFDIPIASDTIRLASSDITALSNFADLKTLYTRIYIQDRAGNATTGATSGQELLIDIEPPADFTCGTLTATGGIIVEGAYNNTNTGIAVEVPVADDASLLNGQAILKLGFVDNAAWTLVTFTNTDTVTLTTVNTTLTMTLDQAALTALPEFQNGYLLYATAGLLDYAGNEVEGTQSANVLSLDFLGPELPVVNDTTTTGGEIVSGYWNASNSGIDFTVATPAIADSSLVGGSIQIQGRVGVESFVDLGDPVSIVTANFTELTVSVDSSALEQLVGFGEDLPMDFRVALVDGHGNDTLGAVIEDWLTIDQVAPSMGTFVTSGTTTDPFINSVDTLQSQWQGFSDGGSGIATYDFSIGTNMGLNDVVDWLNLTTTQQDTLLSYAHAQAYFMNVRATDVAGNHSDTLASTGIVADLEAPLSTSAAEPYYLIDDWDDVNSFGGTYTDALAGVDTLWLDLQRFTDNNYWDGSNWVTDSTTLVLDIGTHDGVWNFSIAADTLSNHANYGIRLLAVDSAGNRQATATLDTFQFIINSAPDFVTAFSDTTSLEDSLFSYHYVATDPDFETARGDTLLYSLNALAPAGMSIDSLTGIISWIPVDSAVGEHVFGIVATDLLGLQDSVFSQLTVLNVNDPPEPVTLLLPVDSTQLQPSDSLLLTFSWTAAFDIESNPLTYTVMMNGTGFDTSLTTTDTSLTVDVSVMDYPVSMIQWSVQAADSEDVSAVTDTFHLTTSPAIAVLNTMDIGLDMRRYRDLDTLFTMRNTGLTNLRWSLVSAPTWLTLATTSGIVHYLDSTDISFNINPVDSTVGRFGDTIRIATNDPLQDTIEVAVGLDIFDIPTPVLAFYKNPAYPGFYTLMIVDSLGMIDTMVVTYAGDTLAVSEVGGEDTDSYLATVSIATEGTKSFELYAANWVGDTTITTSISVSLARRGLPWNVRSPDDQFEISGTGGQDDASQVAVLDTLLSAASGARYQVLGDAQVLADPVLVSMPAATAEEAIYIRGADGAYRELPSITDGERVRAWSKHLGAFKLGPRTLIIPERSKLTQNYPNPFNPSTTIDYAIGFLDGPNQAVTFSVYNLRGQQIRDLVDTRQQPGEYSLSWDGLDDQGKQVSSGIYFGRLITGHGYIKTVKMLVLR